MVAVEAPNSLLPAGVLVCLAALRDPVGSGAPFLPFEALTPLYVSPKCLDHGVLSWRYGTP